MVDETITEDTGEEAPADAEPVEEPDELPRDDEVTEP